MEKLTRKQLAFIDEYFICGMNATEAARRLGYAHPNTQGPRLLVNVGIKSEIENRLKEKHMSADEVIARLADIARSDMSDFLEFKEGIKLPYLDLKSAAEKGLMKLVKKFKYNASGQPEIELYDAQSALALIGKHHQLFTDKIEISWRDKLPPNTNPDEVLKQFAGLLALAAQKQNASND